jgi:hypothetical protein
LPIVQGPFSVAPCQTLISRFATFAWPHGRCAYDIEQLCRDVPPGEGRVLACLKNQRSHLKTHACKAAVLRLWARAVERWDLDAAFKVLARPKPPTQPCASVQC